MCLSKVAPSNAPGLSTSESSTPHDDRALLSPIVARVKLKGLFGETHCMRLQDHTQTRVELQLGSQAEGQLEAACEHCHARRSCPLRAHEDMRV